MANVPVHAFAYKGGETIGPSTNVVRSSAKDNADVLEGAVETWLESKSYQ